MYYNIKFLIFLFFPFVAHSAGEPLSAWWVFTQVLNFSLFAGAFFFFLRKPVQTLFHNRKKHFLSFEKEQADLEKARKKECQMLEEKISGQEELGKTIADQAKTAAKKFEFQKEQELEDLNKKLKRSAEFLILLEKEKAKRDCFSSWKKRLADETKKNLMELAKSSSFQEKSTHTFFNFLKNLSLDKKA